MIDPLTLIIQAEVPLFFGKGKELILQGFRKKESIISFAQR